MPPSAPPALVFVYGTLKRGGSNHARLADQRFLGPARTAPGFALYSMGEYPGLVADPADLDGVHGELWAVDAPALARLDAFEGVDEGLYARVHIPLSAWPETVPASSPPHAWVYLYLRDLEGRPKLGDNWPV